MTSIISVVIKIGAKLGQNDPMSRRQHCVIIGSYLKIASFGLWVYEWENEIGTDRRSAFQVTLCVA